MTTTTNIHKAHHHQQATRFGHQNEANTVPEIRAGAAEQGQTKGKPESELRAAARRHGLTLKELADRMGVN